MGTSCTTVADSEYMTRADDSHWFGYGRILDADAAALDMSGAGLPARVPLERGGFFLFDIPRDQWQALDGRSGDIAVLDSNGKTIRTACVFVGLAPPSPFAGDGSLGDAPGTCAALKPIIPAPELDHAKRLVIADADARPGVLQRRRHDRALDGAEPRRRRVLVHQHRRHRLACRRRQLPGLCGGIVLALARCATLVGDHYANLVEGFVDPKLGAVQAQLVGANVALPVSLANGACLARAPGLAAGRQGAGARPRWPVAPGALRRSGDGR